MLTPSERRRAKVAVLLAVNAVPLVGVLALDWSLVALLAVYWVELGACLVGAAVKALFAEGKPTYEANGFSWLVFGALAEKRGRISLPALPLSIQVANLPAILMALAVGSVGWALFGAIGVGGVGETTGATMTDAESLSVGLGVLAVIFGRAIDVGRYLLGGTHASVPPQQPLRSALTSMAGTGSALLVGGGFVIAGAPPPFVLAFVLAVKLLADVVDVYRDRLEAFDERTSVELGFAPDTPEWERIESSRDGSEIVRPRPSAVVVGGVVRGLRSPLSVPLVASLTLVGLLSTATTPGVAVELLGGAVVVAGAFTALGVFDWSFRYLAMEYRVDDADDADADPGRVVGYDRLFGPQWRLASESRAELERVRSATDRLFGTETLRLDRDDRVYRLPHLSSDAVALASLRSNHQLTNGRSGASSATNSETNSVAGDS
ncbi:MULTISPECIES: DUF6498-containing protein [unclassified Haloferax]|uniref:DUF6498-containing protein n=1 Tax=unclassified Haloferax TaxID=2625095 RepID=UPI001EF9D745|nr:MULTISPECIES: DUF6498-containing protein [unclassified Haloferax]